MLERAGRPQLPTLLESNRQMTEETLSTYVAQLTLAFPDAGPSATVTVTLTPADAVPVGGQAKPLSQCTLAELRAYARELEVGAWDAYEAITLLQLQEEANVDIELRPLDAGGKAGDEVENWLQQAIVLTASAEPAAGAATSEEPPTADVEAPGEASAVAAAGVAETETAAVPEATAAPAPEPATPAPQPDTHLAPPATIIPSQARVRVAGGRVPMALSGGAAVDILLDEAPLRAMQAHALSSLDREVAGVMVGRQPEKQPDGRYVVHVMDSIIAQHTVMHGASVTYTPESWRYLNDTLWERYPNESAVMVGWYHTHPGFGIFLSGMDLFIHQNFFTQIWHVAYVLDPRARTSGFFCWNRQKTRVNRYDFLWPDWAAGSW